MKDAERLSSGHDLSGVASANKRDCQLDPYITSWQLIVFQGLNQGLACLQTLIV
jgi:hypothetical protein